ncbi:chromosome partitioning protein ParB [Paucibacter sp. KBW04]|uniref:ParB/RepB/Spo0J family partition protein n=1 Tax=Paucibacter sp. KBW04 TaxID=2153361 RepID=UPI000F56E2DF|nr:ParB/RepB/Spo0J family partition protein [Paucibacter sp. KBW04]RQO53417.1 chromosome partitioning protein ParB [Paucibacter sp. KBW04]
MALQLDDLAALDAPEASSTGLPLLLPIELIDEDPDQPRIEFDAQTLQELAATVGERGVRQPVSVRPHPSVPGRWVLNFGARRLRASRLAGKTSLPAFVDLLVDSYDQVIENEQREGLSPFALALFVKKRLSAGDSQAEIARRLGKSRPYATYAMALIDAPDWLMALYRAGHCKGLCALYELRNLYEDHSEVVEAWAADRGHISRDDVRTLAKELGQRRGPRLPGPPPMESPSGGSTFAANECFKPQSKRPAKRCNVRRNSNLALLATLNGEVVSILLNCSPEQAGHVFICGPGSDQAKAVEASCLTLIGWS